MCEPCDNHKAVNYCNTIYLIVKFVVIPGISWTDYISLYKIFVHDDEDSRDLFRIRTAFVAIYRFAYKFHLHAVYLHIPMIGPGSNPED